MTGRYVHSLPARGGGDGSTPPPAPQRTYVQSFAVPDTTWTVTHPLGTTTPLVQIYDLNGYAIGDADVFVPDNQTVIVSFDLPLAGRIALQA